ncbi:hypothetical protein OIU78_012074 [Salix suchowensis]|nr:hypothetical protein OIU78_012074 [Salix suchowensis]
MVSCRKDNLNHENLCMAVLIQEVICSDYTFAIHTKNPLSGIPVRYMQRLLVIQVRIQVCIASLPKCIRLGSNGEDLQGYAGAGLYDSALIDEEEKIVLDNSIARIIVDKAFHTSLLNNC